MGLVSSPGWLSRLGRLVLAQEEQGRYDFQESAHAACEVPGPEVVIPRFGISFFAGKE